MKKNIFVVFGIGDTFCDKNSPRCVKRGKTGPSLAVDIQKIIQEDKDNFFGYVFVNEPLDTRKNINVFDTVRDSKILDMKLCSRNIFNVNNQLTVPGHNNESETVLDGNQLDHILRPEDYNLYVAGIDINGVFNSFVEETKKLGYHITIFSDVIKPFNKETVTNIITAVKKRNSNVVFRKS